MANNDYRHSLNEAEFQLLYNPTSDANFFGLIIYKENSPSACLHGIIRDNRLEYWEGGIKFSALEDKFSPAEWKKVIKMLKKTLKEEGLTSCSLLNTPQLNHGLWENRVDQNLVYRASINLQLHEEALWGSIRKSYKSLINWGKNNLTLKLFSSKDTEHVDQAIKAFKDFHSFTAGRQTRSDETWNLQREFIKNNDGFIIHSFLEKELVSSLMILHGNENATYSVAVNKRDLMTKGIPVGHWPLYHAALRCKELDLKRLDLGFIDGYKMTDKEANIALFKKGFSTNIDIELTHHYRL